MASSQQYNDKLGLWVSLGVHVAIIALLFLNVGDWFEDDAPPIAPQPEVIHATAVDNSELNKQKRAEQQRLAQQKIEEQQRQETIRMEQEKRRQQQLLQEKQQALRLEKEKKAREKKEQERQKAEKAKAEKMKAEKAKAEKAKQEAEAKALAQKQQQAEVERLAKEKAAAKRQVEIEAQRRKDAEQREQSALEKARAEYADALSRHIRARWIKPLGAKDSDRCDTLIEQSPTGYVLKVKAVSCSGDEAFKQSVIKAVWDSEPLPGPENPKAFDRKINIVFGKEE